MVLFKGFWPATTAWGSISPFAGFLEKEKFFGNCDCDFRKCFTRYEEFRNFCFDGKISIFKTAALKLAALIRRCKSVESGCMMWKTLPINLSWWGSQLLGTTWSAATWQRGCFSETADWIKDKSYFTALTLQGVADLYLYGYENHLDKTVIPLIRCIEKKKFNRRVLLIDCKSVQNYVFSYLILPCILILIAFL